MWDIGGQESLRSTWNTYYSNTELCLLAGSFLFDASDGFIILVIDSTDRDRLLTTREELYKMLAHEALRDASILIFANKQDMKDSMTIMEISQFLTLSAIKDHPWHIQGCCALTGEGGPGTLELHGYRETTVLCARYCSRHLRKSSEQNRQKSLPSRSLLSRRGERDTEQ
ncbi:putative ADP-ribosylation factor-like protein 5C isoform X5 [Bubalus bubalis]|uniref:putative ADP-ribosylation factor-like protein 5C isoform X5 n=1 Tax=Bubalus bubalis TaxID=89462 RepID=UPI001D0FC28C|nr:putative ADP-ribosylation factor-like protein 5C isoform X5 [Bubalus bubalis]